ncbi:MAG TPA: hypothetical protein PLU35_12815 [Phycisphaerales bacterium]|nr:hypothetical protein [Phycisphaerales bacterium]
MIGASGSEPDGFPEVAIVNGAMNVNTTSLGSGAGVYVYRNTGDWENPANGLTFLQNITEGLVDGMGEPVTVPAEVRFAHMNADEHLDLVVSAASLEPNADPAEGTWGVFVYVWNSQAEQFDLKSHIQTPAPVRGFAIADFDNDGLIDVVAAVDLNQQTYDPLDAAYFLYNLPYDPGRLELAATVVTGTFLNSGDVVAADFNKLLFGLPLIDAVTGDLFDDGVSVLTNGGGFNFGLARRTPACSEGFNAWLFHDMAVGRFTAGSTREDIAGLLRNDQVRILHGDGRGNFIYDCGDNENPGLDTDDFDPPGGGGDPLPPVWNGIAVGHLNGGTKPDLVVTVPADLTSRAWILLGKGDGRFQYNAGDPKYRLPLDDGNGSDFSKLSIQVVCADLNQDGFDDIITSNHRSHTISVLINSTLIVGGP